MKNLSDKNSVYDDIKGSYPLDEDKNQLPEYLRSCLRILNKKLKTPLDARYGQSAPRVEYDKLVKKYSVIPKRVNDPIAESHKIVGDLFEGVMRWRSPYLQHNVGSPVHTVAATMYSLALDTNIYSIDDGLAGNSLVAEKAVVNILSDLAKLDNPAAGFFVFGGTATNLYASKVGLQKALPEFSKKGTNHNVKLLIAEDAHFTHRLSADWLGIGTDNVLVIKANKDRTSSIVDAENKLRAIIESGNLVSAIMLNGGTTYNHSVDSIYLFVKLRDKLVKDYNLSYKPHIHVDAVIGWSWLFFGDYDFNTNPLGISEKALSKIQEQYDSISQLKYADSWGVDFHKGIGGCPVDCSVIMFNNQSDVFTISKSHDSQLATHQLATEFTNHAPSDFTLETSRSGGTGLAALATLRSLGVQGYQRNLANLIEATCVLRSSFKNKKDMIVANEFSLGFSTMLRIYPPDLAKTNYPQMELTSRTNSQQVEYVNQYIKEFFKWDFGTRIAQNDGPSPSYSSSFMKHGGRDVSALKFYPTSPHFNSNYAEMTAKTMIRRKAEFDIHVWPKHRQ